MISTKIYINWIRDFKATKLYMISIGYNPNVKKRIIKQGNFDIENPIIDIKLFSKILSRIVEKYIGNTFNVRLINTKYSFLPNFFPRNNPDVILMKNYLDKINWKKKKYYGEFTIDNIHEFLTVFVNYSLNHNYQDVLLFSIDNDFVIQISHHGDIWLTSKSRDNLMQIGDKLDKKGATVIYVKIKN